MEALRQQQGEIQHWSREAGQLFQAEVEKAVVQGLTDAFRTLADRLPSLLGEMCRQHLPPPSGEPPALSLVSPWTPPRESAEAPGVLHLALDEAELVTETTEQKASLETTAAEQATASAPVAAPSEQRQGERAQAARTHYRRAVRAGRQGDSERALAHFTEVIRLVPHVAAVYLARGQLLRRLGRTEDSLADADRALQLDPQLTSAYYLRAAAYTRLGDNLRAIADLTRFLEVKPDHALGHHARGLAHANEGHYDRAISDYGRALRLRPQFLLARYHRAIAYRLKGEYVFAVVELTKIIQLRPDFARVYFERALARLALEEHDRAVEDLDKAMERAPEDEEIHARRRQAMQARESSQKTTASAETSGLESPPLPPTAPKQPVPHADETENADPTFLPLSCPACGAPGRISWKRLDRLFRCRSCGRRFRVNREGNLTDIDPNPVVSRRSRLLKRGVAPMIVLVLFLVLAVSSYPRFRQKSALPELPTDLASRGELWGKAWLNDDRLLLRRLTAPTHDRQLHPWLARHPPPAKKERELVSAQGSSPPEIQVHVQKTRSREAVVLVRITASPLKSPEAFRLDWIERGEVWYFVPTLKR
ncbi:MAG TPA: tetratricopeptide repeat protein [Gemmataceae bacterium]